MKLSTRCKYAVTALFDMAFHSAGVGTQVRQIAQRQNIPMRFLEQIFQDLRRADIVTGKRGRNGGYVLAKQTSDISILDIVLATDGPIEFSNSPASESVGTNEPDVPKLLWTDIELEFAEILAARSLASMVDRAIKLGVPRGEPGYMYFI
jgi:Rrf2 family transcriptional regulator, iron-sulfur cluster assembly transcription factor